MSITRFPSLPKPLFGVSKDWKPCSKERLVMHIDMNAYFASVEQSCRPFLKGKPVLVSADPYGTPKGARSVAATASYEAREYGVHAGMPLFEALRLCPHAIVVEGDARKYLSISLRILEILETFTDLVEPYSIDEAFIDVTSTAHLFGGKVAVAREIKRTARQEFGITCSIGIGPNKLTAKMASNMEKPDGLVVIEKKDLPEAIWNLSVDAIPGVGCRRKFKMNLMGIKTIRDLALHPRENLRRAFGIVGEYLQQCAWGRDDSPVVSISKIPDPKSISAASTFFENTSDSELILSALFYLSEKAAVRLRKHRLKARVIGAWVRDKDFSSKGKMKKLPAEVESFEKIYHHAKEIFKENYLPPEKPVRLVGVYLSGLSAALFEESSLFPEIQKRELIDRVLFEAREKFGTKAVFRARSLIGKDLVMA